MTALRRRWSFSLRTLFVVVTALACWLGWELHVVRKRQEGLRWLRSQGAYIGTARMDKQSVRDLYRRRPDLPRKSFSVPFVRRLLGDEPIIQIGVDEEIRDEAQRLFPEAVVAILGNREPSADMDAEQP